jgi:hypothetical protein
VFFLFLSHVTLHNRVVLDWWLEKYLSFLWIYYQRRCTVLYCPTFSHSLRRNRIMRAFCSNSRSTDWSIYSNCVTVCFCSTSKIWLAVSMNDWTRIDIAILTCVYCLSSTFIRTEWFHKHSREIRSKINLWNKYDRIYEKSFILPNLLWVYVQLTKSDRSTQ